MRKVIIKAFRILLFLSVGFFLLALAFRDVSLNDLVSGLRTANYYWVLLSLLFATLAFISRTFRWILLIEPLGHKPSAKNTFYAVMNGYLANFILPRLGEVTRCASLNRTDGIPVDSLVGTVITERISDLLALFLLVIYLFFVKIEFFGEFLYTSILFPAYMKIASWLSFSSFIYILIFATLVLLAVFYSIIASWLRKYKIYRRVEKIAGSIIKGTKSVLHMKKPIQFMLHTIFIWLMYYLMTWTVFMALQTTAGLDGNAVLFILVIGGLGMAVPVQGGIGAYHWIVSVGLGLYGIPRETGLVFATLSHESQALLMILIGSFTMLFVFGGLIIPKPVIQHKNGQAEGH